MCHLKHKVITSNNKYFTGDIAICLESAGQDYECHESIYCSVSGKYNTFNFVHPDQDLTLHFFYLIRILDPDPNILYVLILILILKTYKNNFVLH